MKPPIDRPKAIAQGGRRPALTWVDFLVIAATVLTFGAVLMAYIPSGKSGLRAGAMTGETPATTVGNATGGHLPNDQDLVKARIRLASGGPWG